jgi:hypothetical protein
MFRSSDHDPLAAAIAPPKNESSAARAARLRAEAEARRVSDEIDEQLKLDRVARRRQRPCVKVLLLGQSESGTFFASSYLGTSHPTSSFRAQENRLRSRVSVHPLSPTLSPVLHLGLLAANGIISGDL